MAAETPWLVRRGRSDRPTTAIVLALLNSDSISAGEGFRNGTRYSSVVLQSLAPDFAA